MSGSDKYLELLANRDFAGVDAVARPLAKAGDRDAQFALAFLFFCETDMQWSEARSWLELAAASGHPDAMYYLAVSDDTVDPPAFGIPTTELARELLVKAGASGSRKAQLLLGHLFATGEAGFSRNLMAARDWYRIAAEANCGEAQYELAMMCLRGEGGDANATEARQWLTRAASATPPHADAAKVLREIPEAEG